MNKRIILGSSIIAAALMLGGCSTATDTTTTTTPEPTATWSAEDEFLSDLHSVGGFRTYNVTDEELIGMGYQVCDLLDEGATVMDLTGAIAANDTGDEAQMQAMTAVVASAVVNLCPRYKSQLG